MARQANLLSVEEAQDRILRRFSQLETETASLTDAYNRVLAVGVSSPINVPPFANSSMDGFAVRAEDTESAAETQPASLPVSVHIPAGSTGSITLQPGTCARIMTGAPLPEGADSVVPFEDVTDEGERIVLRSPVGLRACVRPAAQDVRAGQEVLAAGTTIGPPEVALLASIGRGDVPVARRPRVAILSTGDELVAPGKDLQRGQIYNSNSPMLEAAVREAGGEPRILHTAHDDAEAIGAALSSARDVDLILTSGGASVGDFDHVKDVIGAEGELSFWRVRVRPGKPLLFGSIAGVPVIGLPGNPTSAMVTFELFARPAIRTMLGTSPWRASIRAVAGERFDNRGGRRSYLRVALRFSNGTFVAYGAGPQDSAMIRPLAAADGLLVVPEEKDALEEGDEADVILWRLPAPSPGSS